MVTRGERAWADVRCAGTLVRSAKDLTSPECAPGTRRGERVLGGQRGDPHSPALDGRYYCSNGFSIMGLYYVIFDT